MSLQSRWRHAPVILAAGLLLNACAETNLAVHAIKSIGRASDETAAVTPAPRYKIGSPYQIDGVWYYPAEDYRYAKTGTASWYGDQFHGRLTANGEIFDKMAMTAAHPTLPMPSQVRVTNLRNGRSLELRVNDRGPFVDNRIIDVSQRAAQELGFELNGLTPVKVEIMPRESQELKLAALRLNPAGATQFAGKSAPAATTREARCMRFSWEMSE